MTGRGTNEHAPPSSAEEAAALLGAAISITDSLLHAGGMSSSRQSGETNPPQGMHSIFAVQTPLPNQILFVRLVNLRAWLRLHATNTDTDGLDDSLGILGISFPVTTKKPCEPFNAARSILAVLMKLLDASSSIANGEVGKCPGEDDPLKAVKSLSTPSPRQSKHNALFPCKITRQHTLFPPLLSTPVRNVWVECISLCLSVGCSLSGNLRVDVWPFLSKMMEICSWNPRSKMAAGGVRLATLEVLGHACKLNYDLAMRTAPFALEILQCCHKGLMSGGTGEPGHRAACVRTACQMLVACRRAANSSFSRRHEDSFAVPGTLEELVAVEAIRFIKRAASDKYPEVRMRAAVFTGLAAPLLIRIVPSAGSQRGGVVGKDGDAHPLAWLEEVTQLSLRNIDDESAGVSTAWSNSLARCLCASAEYGANVQNAKLEDYDAKRSTDVEDLVTSTIDGLVLARKLKAFSEARRAVPATTACSSVISTIVYLVSQFVKSGGETVANKCGGAFSIGGRARRIGFADAVTEFLRLQAAKGDFSFANALGPVLEMVGEAFDKQIPKNEQSLDDFDFYAPISPRSTDKTSPAPSMFLARNLKVKSAADSNIGRMLTSNVIRKGISENVPESSQLLILRQLTSACSLSVSLSCTNKGTDDCLLNRHQVQVALVELSHVIITLGEAGASSLEDILPVLHNLLSHADAGVRQETSAVFASISQAFPAEGRKFVLRSLNSFGSNLDAILSLSRITINYSISMKVKSKPSSKDQHVGTAAAELLKRQATLHGNSLAVSMLMHEFIHLVGGVAAVIIDRVFDVVSLLLNCQFDEEFAMLNPSAICTCIRAGYCLLSGALSMGIDAIVPHHVTTVFYFWQKSVLNLMPGVSMLAPSSDLLWLEMMLASIVSFLKFSPDLLLAVPDALTRLTSLLENIFPFISSIERFRQEAHNPVSSARLASARSSVMEAYSWLPPGSFPLSANKIFSFATAQIQELNEIETLNSIINSLVSKEDELIEAYSVERAFGPCQVGGSVALDNSITIRSSDIVHHSEREAVLHILAWRRKFLNLNHDDILSLYLRKENEFCFPTALHEVGTWRAPSDPIGTSKVRLLDSCIHAFAATFGLQDGHTQSEALCMLESLHTSNQVEKSKVFSSLIAESQGKVKLQEDDVAASNVIATVLACLQALPIHESTHNGLVDRGPLWMEKATSLLLHLLPSPSGIIRRGAAEGLSLLATLGVSGDAHTLQSSILHSLDEVMNGINAGSNQKSNLDALPFARAGALLALACIQRAANRMKRNSQRAKSRSVVRDINDGYEDNTPVLIMMTRVLPSLATQNAEDDSLLSRTYALHSLGIIISNSIPTGTPLLSDQIQIIWKAVESVETSFLNAWSAVASEISKGREREKFSSLPAFLAVLIRLMTSVLPWLTELMHLDCWIASRFSCYVFTALEYSLNHPAILFEGCVFFQRLSANTRLVRLNHCCVVNTDKVAVTAAPFLLLLLRPPYSKVVAESELDFINCQGPIFTQLSSVLCLKGMCASSKSLEEDFIVKTAKVLFSFLNDCCGRRKFQHLPNFRALAHSRIVINSFGDCQMLETEVVALIHMILNVQIAWKDKSEVSYTSFKWFFFCRCIAIGAATEALNESDSYSENISTQLLIDKASFFAQANALAVLKGSNQIRWQLKCLSANLASVAINEHLSFSGTSFNFSPSSICNIYGFEIHLKPISLSEELVTIACSLSTSTSNNSDLPSVQICGLRLLVSLFRVFGSQLDASTSDGTSVLAQYSSQIVSSVNYALNAEKLAKEHVPSTAHHHLFAAGCETLFIMIFEEVISDPVALRRLLQPVWPAAVENSISTQFPTRESSANDSLFVSLTHVTDNLKAYPLFKVSKLWFIAKATMLIAMSEIKLSTISTFSNELEREETERAIQCTANAIDGFLLHCWKENFAVTVSSGLTFKNSADLDDFVVKIMIKSWPLLSATAVISLAKAIKFAAKESCLRSTVFHQWITKLTTIVLSGFHQFLSTLQNSSILDCAALVHALRIIVTGFDFVVVGYMCPFELGDIVDNVTDSFFSLVLDLSELGDTQKEQLIKDHRIVKSQFCALIEDLCQQNLVIGLDISVLIRAVITPLAAVQRGQEMESNVISSCLRSSQALLQYQPEGQGKFQKALVQLILILMQDSSETNGECLFLLKALTEKSLLSQKERGQIAEIMASYGQWSAWALMCPALSPRCIRYSLNAVKSLLGDLKSGPFPTLAMVAFFSGLQSAMVQDTSLIFTVLQHIGFEILQLFRAYALHMLVGEGLDENRAICGDGVKINVMVLQYMTSETNKYDVVSYLRVFFEVLIESISFNGMPNHPTGKVGGDESIGRMCAQVFVHVAKSYLTLFKSTVALLSVEKRAVIEMAVRADMSGFARQNKIKTKKRISLKGFVQ